MTIAVWRRPKEGHMNAMAKTRRSKHHKKPLWDLCLYVANRTPRSLLAIENLNEFCKKYLAGRYRIKIVNILARPQIARTDNIVAVPTLVRKKPGPERRLIGVLSESARMISGLQIKTQA